MDHRTRLHRPRAYNDPGHAHELTCSCHRRYPLLSKDRSCERLTRLRVQRGARIEHHFWQPGRGHDRNIVQPRTLQTMIDYVHLNPVRTGLVTQTNDWKWSSDG